MIKHNVCKFEPKVHTVEIPIKKEEFNRINKLFEIKNLEELSEEQLKSIGAKKNVSECIFSVAFDDGTELDWFLCSGSVNYFDDVIFHYADKSLCEDVLDCTFELDDIEISTVTDTYIVKLTKI